ncbi:MAG: hypothetical protein JSS91_11960 [Bacteroidetes bacterium]|nr:hypothetical protein [Bacteroidota bacterium]
MQNNFHKYIEDAKSRLDSNYLSPLFFRLANLYYLNEQYEECISVCKSGLNIYPNYLTIKLILLKAFLKAEYLNEAENIFNEIKNKISVREIIQKLSGNIQNLRSVSGQEKIYYPKESKIKFDFRTFEKKFDPQEKLFTEFSVNDLLYKYSIPDSDPDFKNFEAIYSEFHFRKNYRTSGAEDQKAKSDSRSDSELEKHIKIITETLADLYAEQRNYKQAYEAYSFLIRAGSPNSKRIEEKLNELERNMVKYDSI